MANGRVYYVMVPEDVFFFFSVVLPESREFMRFECNCGMAGYLFGDQHRSHVLVVCRGLFAILQGEVPWCKRHKLRMFGHLCREGIP